MGKTAVREPQTERPAAPAPASECRHHWLIETPRGATSHGRCKVCGETREFRNSTTDYVWDDDSSSGYGSWSGVRKTPKVTEDDGEMVASPSSGEAIAV
jgi:hypothetical protein